jgi:hypothetical protein
MNHSFDPETLYCSAGECLAEATVSGYATFEVGGLCGARLQDRLLTFTLPLCPHHEHLMRSESTFVDFHAGAPYRDQT